MTVSRHLVLLTGFILVLTVTQTWGQIPNPTQSDSNFNTAGGADALSNVDETASGGLSNTAFGNFALRALTTGSSNSAFGASALRLETTGSKNTAVGHKALRNATGEKNIGIGYQAGESLGTGNSNIYIGHQGAGDEFQTIRIGIDQTSLFIAGADSTVSNGTVLEINTATGRIGIGPSSERYKQDIATMGARSSGVSQLRPVTFVYKGDASRATHYGLVAEEVLAVYPELVTRTATGEVQAVKYLELIPMLLNELQRQQQELAELRALVKTRLPDSDLITAGRDLARGEAAQ